MENKKFITDLVLLDNNILDKSVYVSNVKKWEIEEQIIKDSNGEYKRIIATKKFINKATGEEASQTIISKNRLPTHQDSLILFTLISMCQKERSPIIKTSIYQILKNLGWSRSNVNYSIVKEGINIWWDLEIIFDKCFYSPEHGYINIRSKVISNIEESEDLKYIEIAFNPKIIELMTKNKFFTGLYISNYKMLKSAFQRRLYEILIKSFNKSLTYEIRWYNLREKLEDDSKHRSTFIRKLSRAIEAINKKTDLKIQFEIYEDDMLLFRILNEEIINMFKLIDFLETYLGRHGITKELLLKIKNKCKLIKSGKSGYVLKCSEELKEEINKNEWLKKMITAFQIKKII